MNTDTSTARLIEAVIGYCAEVWNDDEIIDVLTNTFGMDKNDFIDAGYENFIKQYWED
jgi:hypothetical protein